MGVIIPVGYGQISWEMGGPQLPTGGTVTLGFENAGSLSAQEAADNAIVTWVARIRPIISDDVIGCVARVKLGPDSTGPQATSASALGGQNTGEGILPSVSILVQKVTALGGRRNRGRMYWPGLNEDEVDSSGNINGTAATAWSGAMGSVFADLVADGMPPVVLHSDSGAPTPCTTFNVLTIAATQRQRLRR